MDETFREALNDDCYLRWLAKNLDYKTYRLKALLKSYKQQQQTRHALSADKHQQIYDYWLNEKVSIPTTDRRSGRDEIKIGKLQYLREYKHLANIQDDNQKEKDLVFKKTGKSKTYVTAHPRIYTKPICQLFKEFTESSDMRCSFSTFYKYRPFYISPPTERKRIASLHKMSKCSSYVERSEQLQKSEKFNAIEFCDSISSVEKLHVNRGSRKASS